MNNTRETVGVDSRAQNGEAPATVEPVTRAKSENKKSHYTLLRRALLAIVLNPVYQSVIAGITAAGIILMGGHHGF